VFNVVNYRIRITWIIANYCHLNIIFIFIKFTTDFIITLLAEEIIPTSEKEERGETGDCDSKNAQQIALESQQTLFFSISSQQTANGESQMTICFLLWFQYLILMKSSMWVGLSTEWDGSCAKARVSSRNLAQLGPHRWSWWRLRCRLEGLKAECAFIRSIQ